MTYLPPQPLKAKRRAMGRPSASTTSGPVSRSQMSPNGSTTTSTAAVTRARASDASESERQTSIVRSSAAIVSAKAAISTRAWASCPDHSAGSPG